MKFPYRKILLPAQTAPFGHALLRPIIPLRVTIGSRSVQYEVLLDSGADFCIFDGDIADALGIDTHAGEPLSFGGIQQAAHIVAFLHTVTLEIGGHAVQSHIGFSYDIAKNGYGILGQRGFFDQFMVTFDYQKKEIVLKLRSSH